MTWLERCQVTAQQNLKLATKLRDAWTCQDCGVRDSPGNPITTHHVIPKKHDVSLVNDPANQVTLCRRCHDGRRPR